ncbi:glutamate--tRNA ligase [candidate division WWE3 bacterium]|uniref:Glutamate--tRNA ligase n=1 Tax=candidate division WWE3 bacterium TaxID=2053526 RepID=A0A955RP63_UNCKA|nr:glutamate--tRNA ligase [candidate division WWE3 bacterium]
MTRTRMAPSPTGEYHIGHIRTVLYNYALAKKDQGAFVIRIEDTDRTRFVEGSMERILEVIKDYGLSWDEGPQVGGDYGPYIQSERLGLYKKYAEDLVEKGHAYYCFCSEDRLKELRASQQEKGIKPMYDRYCAENIDIREAKQRVTEGESYVIRLKIPRDETISFHDEVLGDISFAGEEVDDQVLLKSDGFPTYHLAVVVDDHLMEITHIMRGSDWVSSTPKHVLLYKYFGWETPKFIHLPNLKEVGAGKKLSKRFGSVSAREFLDEGYLPEALLNFLMLLGWNPGTDEEIFSVDEFIQKFDLANVHSADLVAFDREKLLWFNGVYIRNFTVSELTDRLISYDEAIATIDRNKLEAVVSLIQERIKVFSEFRDLTYYFFDEINVTLDAVVQKSKTADDTRKIIPQILAVLEEVPEEAWQAEKLEELLRGLQDQLTDWSPKELFMTIRLAVTGEKATPPLFDTISVLGKQTTLDRLQSLIQ